MIQPDEIVYVEGVCRMTTDTKPLPCPWCGGQPRIESQVIPGVRAKRWWLSCCAVEKWFDTHEAAIAWWNTRKGEKK